MKYGMLIDLTRCIGCGACVFACKQENGTASGIYWCTVRKGETGKYPSSKMVQIPYACMHCMNADCVSACPTGASYKAEDGRTMIDYDECIGCEMCLQACPYDVRQYTPPEAAEMNYWGNDSETTAFEDMKTKNRKTRVAQKCEMCPQLLAQGLEPACVQTCLTKCRVFGDLDDPESEISKKIVDLNAQRLLPDLNSDQNVFYAGDISFIPKNRSSAKA